MHKETKRIGLLVTMLLVAGLATAPALAGDESKMAERILDWQAAFNSGDAGALAEFYAVDAQRLAYQAPTINGQAAIAENIKATRDQGIVKIQLAVTSAETHGDMGWATGTYHLMNAEDVVVQSGKWMNVSKKVKGKWLIQADIWNTNAPE